MARAAIAAVPGPSARSLAAPTTDAADESPLGMLLLLSCIAIWGVNAVAGKVGTRLPYGFDPALFTGLRFLLVAPCITALIAWRQPEALKVPDRRDLLRYAIYSLVSIVIGETLLTLSVRYTSVANMTLLGPGTISLFTALWAVALKEQRLTRTGWIGACVAFLGVGLVAGVGTAGFRLDPLSLRGDLIALSRSAVHGAYLIFLTRTLRERPVATVTVYNIGFAALLFLPYVLWRAPQVAWTRVPGEVWGSLAWTVLPTTVYGFLAWNLGMRRVGAVGATNMMYLQPVCGALAAWAILGEPLRLGQIIGGAVIVAGIVALRWDVMMAAPSSASLSVSGGLKSLARRLRRPSSRTGDAEEEPSATE